MISRKLRSALLALTGTAALAGMAIAAPFPGTLPGGDESEENGTVVKIRSSRGSDPLVIRLPELATGETRELTTEGGKKVTVTRTEEGLKIKAGEKDVFVALPGNGICEVGMEGGEGSRHARVMVFKSDGTDGEGAKVRVLGGPGGASAFAFTTKDGSLPPMMKFRHPASAEDLLKDQKLESYDRMDRKTRDAVAEVLDELLEKGAIMPGFHAMALPGDGEGVEVQVERKRTKKTP